MSARSGRRQRMDLLAPTPCSALSAWFRSKRRARAAQLQPFFYRDPQAEVAFDMDMDDLPVCSTLSSASSSSESDTEVTDWLDERLMTFDHSMQEEEEEEAEDAEDAEDEEEEAIETGIRVIVINEDSSLLLLPNDMSHPLAIVEGDLVANLVFGDVSLNGYRMKINESVKLSTGLSSYSIAVQVNGNQSTLDSDLTTRSKALKRCLRTCDSSDKVIDDVDEELKSSPHYPHLSLIYLNKWTAPSIGWVTSVVNKGKDKPRENLSKDSWFRLSCEDQDNPVTSEWEKSLHTNLIDKFSTESVVIVSGEKNSGKSSLIRWAVNLVLSQAKAATNRGVLVLDCDPGQSEFSPSAQMTVALIDEPILSAPFVNCIQMKKKVLFGASVGGINPANDPDAYLVNLKHIWTRVTCWQKANGKRPLLINTMGWMSGIGLNLLVDLIWMVRPSDLIEIKTQSDVQVEEAEDDEEVNGNNENETDNDLTPEFVARAEGWAAEARSNRRPTSSALINYNYIQIKSKRWEAKNREEAKRRSLEARLHRKLALLAYLSQVPDILFKPLHAVTPYKLSLNRVILHVVNVTPVPKELILDIMNLSWVQLCSLPQSMRNGDPATDGNQIKTIDENLGENDCIGCGIIRSIDVIERVVYLLTAEPFERVNEVNCLIKPNGIFIPEELVCSQLSFNNYSVPYVGVL